MMRRTIIPFFLFFAVSASAGQVLVTWDNYEDPADGFRVRAQHRDTGALVEKEITGSSATSYQLDASHFTPGIYDLWVVAFQLAKESPKSNIVEFGIPQVASPKTALVYAGGVFGIETMMDAVASRRFRFLGGGFYLHGVGWNMLSDEQRKKVVEASEGAPVAVELGFGNGENHDREWADRLKSRYRKHNVEPDFILTTAFNKGNVPTVERWDSFVADFRGADYKNPIYPIFEYANYRDNRTILTTNKVSQRTDFQTIVKHAGGISIDTAAGYFFEKRDENYREWILDAIKWTKGIGGKTIVIASPMNSQDLFREHVIKFVAYLKNANAMPDTFIIENYETDPSPTYIPVVGREWIEDTCFGVGLYLLTSGVLNGTSGR